MNRDTHVVFVYCKSCHGACESLSAEGLCALCHQRPVMLTRLARTEALRDVWMARAERAEAALRDWRSLPRDPDWGTPRGWKKLQEYERRADAALAVSGATPTCAKCGGTGSYKWPRLEPDAFDVPCDCGGKERR